MRALLVAAARPARASSARAQTGLVFNRTGSGARAAGMANAFIAVSDDGTAASWNPAGLAQLRMPELSIVNTTCGQSLTAQGFRTLDGLSTYTPTSSSYQDAYLDFASLALPVTIAGKPVTFQGAWRRLYELDYRAITSTTREPIVPEAPPAASFADNHDVVGSVDLVSLATAVRAHAPAVGGRQLQPLARRLGRDVERRARRRSTGAAARASRPPARRTACAARTSTSASC